MKKFLGFIFIVLLGLFIYYYFTFEMFKVSDLLSSVTGEANITNYSIFGNHLNIEGYIDDITSDLALVLKNKDEEINLDIKFNSDNSKTYFYISDNLNDSIDLDELSRGHYILLLKDNDTYYTLKNTTNYGDLEYYTITKKHSNNKININFKNSLDKEYVEFIIKRAKLDGEVYDITIDPGHGGKDPGAIYNYNGKEYHEADLTLDISLLVKEKLEDYGYKVKITRETDEYIEPYGENGRAVIPNKTNSKYSFSIHLNSDYGIMTYGGVEVYTPNNIDLTLARSMASNIAGILDYSKNNNYKLENGVYYKYFKESDIVESNNDLKSNNMYAYDIKLNCPYMYMIREVGGLNTKAYIDDRNGKENYNIYYDSIKTAEPYLIEVGYINYPNSLNKILNNKDDIANAITNTFINYMENKKS